MNNTAALRREVQDLRTRIMALENELRIMRRTHDERLDYVERIVSEHKASNNRAAYR